MSDTVVVEPYEGPSEPWDRFVEKAEGGSFCHLAEWRHIFGKVLGHAPLYLAAHTPEGEWRGLLPLVRMKSLLFGDHLISVPFLNYGGPLGDDSAREALVEEARRQASELGVDVLEIRARHPLPVDAPDGKHKITVVLPLPDDPEVLWTDGLRSKIRSQVRRPRKEGMEARFGPEQLSAFYDVFRQNMRDLGTPVHSRGFFEAMVATFPDLVRIGAVYHEGEPVAGGFGFLWNGELEITWASALREVSRLAPNMLLYWSFMETAIAGGAHAFNFGRCTPGGGTHRFKSQWGGEDEELHWASWPPSDAPEDEDDVRELATRIWSRLPLPVADRLGPILARRIPVF